MKRIEIDNCYQCLYYQTFGGQFCGKIAGTKLLTAKEAKNIPDWCPLPDVEENKIAELLRGYFRWHDEMGFISHKDGDIDEYVSNISK